ncbi:MAG: hypothetical protein IPM51_17290 [Sphingobacteriaceae bacterium]|nr:hypothetical protein [Sphingobacteriaceae bacterium]
MSCRLIILIVLILFLGSSCKKQTKYEEDPKKSRTSPKLRLKGTWGLEDYTFNCNSIIPHLNLLSTKYNINETTLQFSESYNNRWSTSISSNNKSLYSYHDIFSDDYTFFIQYSGTNDSICCKWFITPFRYVRYVDSYWRITKLYDKDLNIVLDTDTGQFKIFFKKQ